MFEQWRRRYHKKRKEKRIAHSIIGKSSNKNTNVQSIAHMSIDDPLSLPIIMHRIEIEWKCNCLLSNITDGHACIFDMSKCTDTRAFSFLISHWTESRLYYALD